MVAGVIPSIKASYFLNLWFSEFMLMGFLLPFLVNQQGGRKWGMISVLSVMFTMVSLNIVILLAFGKAIDGLSVPFSTAVQYINIGDFLAHLESLVMAFWIMGAFIKIAVLLYILSLGIAQWFSLSEYRPLVFPVAFLVILLAFWQIPNVATYLAFVTSIGRCRIPSIRYTHSSFTVVHCFYKKKKEVKAEGGAIDMKRIVVLFLMIWMFLLSGCWDQKELNELVLIDGIGIDKAKDGQVEVTVSIAIPQAQSGGGGGGGGGGKGAGGTHLVAARYAKGDDVAKALEQVQTQIPRKVFLGHLQAIIISEKVAKEGITDYLDLFLRHPRPSTHTYVFISKGSAKELLSLQTDLYSPVELMRGIARTETLMSVTTLEVLEMLKDGDTAIPMIEKLPPAKGKKSNQTIPYLNHTAIFNKDKMVGSMDDSLTRGAMWIRNEIKEARITIIPKNETKPVTLSVLNANTKLVPKISGNRWKMTIKGKASGMIISSETDQNLTR